jgi:death-on-curing protein
VSTTPVVTYLEIEEVEAIHDQLIELNGGIPGYKGGSQGQSLVASALARPINKSNYENADLQTQAAALMFGIAKNHGFNDGNKRTALMATYIFIRSNGYRFTCDNDTIAGFLEQCSDATWTEELAVTFLKTNTEPTS